MADPYRTPSCPACEGETAAHVECLHCRGACCEACALAGVCAACVARALEVANRVLGAKGAGVAAARPRARRPRFGMAIALGSFLGTVAAWAVSFVLQGAAVRELGHALAARVELDRLTTLAAASKAPPRPAAVPSVPDVVPLRPPSRRAPEDEAPFPARLLARVGAPTNDPAELLARAERLRASGVDLTIVHAHLSRAAATAHDFSPAFSTIDPVVRGGEIAGLVLRGFPPDATPITAGLANGDVVASVNGVPLTSPALALDALAAVRKSRRAVVEVLRGERRLVLSIDWPAA